MTGFPHGILFILFFILLILIRNAHKHIGFQTRKSVKLLGSGCRNIGKNVLHKEAIILFYVKLFFLACFYVMSRSY